MNSPLLGLDGVVGEGEVPGDFDLARQSVAMDLVDRCNGQLILHDGWVAGCMLPLTLGVAVVLIVNDVRQKATVERVE